MKKPKNCYWIMFSQRDSVSTCLSPSVEPGGNVYYLKAKALGSSQHVGYAVVTAKGRIAVLTASGKRVGAAETRAEAAEMIDSHHRKNNRSAYWMWFDTPFWNDGKIARPQKRKKASR